ncbi:MAG: hypothetical protein WKF37_09810 [Bryobacteraceae bacterium]
MASRGEPRSYGHTRILWTNLYVDVRRRRSLFNRGEGIRLSDGADAGWPASNDNLVHLISTWDNPYLTGQFTRYERTNQAANLQATGPTGPSAFNRSSRMPHELTWSLGVQQEITPGWVFETTYNANAGRRLLGPDVIGRFPSDLFTGGPTGQNARTYTTQVASPTAGQTLANSVVGPKQNLAILEMDYPYFGALAVQGSNIGRSNYHGVNFRLERRPWHGVYYILNYTFSKSLDDVGGPNLGTGAGISGSNLGGKRAQTVDPVTAIYGVSPIDETHVVRFTYNIELPFGRGEGIFTNPTSIGGKLADWVGGGWELSGLGTTAQDGRSCSPPPPRTSTTISAWNGLMAASRARNRIASSTLNSPAKSRCSIQIAMRGPLDSCEPSRMRETPKPLLMAICRRSSPTCVSRAS